MYQLRYMKIFVTIALLLTLGAIATVRAATLTLESATMGPAGQGAGLPLSSTNFVGWRFNLTTPLAVTQVGGHVGGVTGTLFAAIIPLTAIDALPTGAPFDATATYPHTTFIAPQSTADVRTPLAAVLQPGAYALVIGGSGQFDANGSGWIPNSQQPNIAPTTQTSYITWRQNLPGKFSWSAGTLNNVRLVVTGSPYAGPADFNKDGAIDGLDLAAWKASVNAPGVTPRADANADNVVDGADFLAWQRTHAPTPPAPATTAPEPATFPLLAAATLALSQRLRLRRVGR
jgi:hypothetical protein